MVQPTDLTNYRRKIITLLSFTYTYDVLTHTYMLTNIHVWYRILKKQTEDTMKKQLHHTSYRHPHQSGRNRVDEKETIL